MYIRTPFAYKRIRIIRTLSLLRGLEFGSTRCEKLFLCCQKLCFCQTWLVKLWNLLFSVLEVRSVMVETGRILPSTTFCCCLWSLRTSSTSSLNVSNPSFCKVVLQRENVEKGRTYPQSPDDMFWRYRLLGFSFTYFVGFWGYQVDKFYRTFSLRR